MVGFRCFRRQLLFSSGGDVSARFWRFCGLGVAVVSFFQDWRWWPEVLVLQWWPEVVVLWWWSWKTCGSEFSVFVFLDRTLFSVQYVFFLLEVVVLLFCTAGVLVLRFPAALVWRLQAVVMLLMVWG